MAIQIRGVQIQDGSIASGKLAISGATFDFSSGTLRAGTPSASTDVANKAYVDAQLPDSFSGGDGIAIDSSGDPDVISVDLATNSAQIADDAVQNAQIQNGAVSIAKLSFQARVDQPSTSGGSTSVFALSNQVAPEFENFVMVFRNGLLQQLKASSPADDSEYTVSTSGGTTSVTFGANISASDKLEIRYLA
jgi:hypothetical protein